MITRTSAGLLDCRASSTKKSLSWNFTNHFWLIRSVTAPLHMLHKTFFFLHFSCIGTFVKIIKHNMLKILLFLPSLILKLLLKIYQFWSAFFFFSNVYWQLLQCNLTKLFWIKLKTTNPEQSHLMEKKQMNILANPVILFWLNN